LGEILELARLLSPLDKLKLIEGLAPDLEEALAAKSPALADPAMEDELYQIGYERFPEDVTDLAALMPHLAIPPERWE
jgi:hypothetical protein